jgi:hypothetical protein
LSENLADGYHVQSLLAEAKQLPTSDFREWYEDIAHFVPSLLRCSCLQSITK